MRYLAELPWVPQALHPTTRPRGVTPRRRMPSTSPHPSAGPTCPCGCTSTRPATWRGRFGDYGVLGGVRIPTSAEVWWELPEGRFTYFRGAVTGLEALPS